jgi:hypothetical protein
MMMKHSPIFSCLMWGTALVIYMGHCCGMQTYAAPLETLRPNSTENPQLLPEKTPLTSPAKTSGRSKATSSSAVGKQPVAPLLPEKTFPQLLPLESGADAPVSEAVSPATKPSPPAPADPFAQPMLNVPNSSQPTKPVAPATTASEDETRELDIESDKLVYDDLVKAYIVTGHVRMVVADQNAELLADKVTYQPDADLIVAEGNLRLTKEGQVTEGAYARIRLNGQTALITQPNTTLGFVRLRAKDAVVRPEMTHLRDGAIIVIPREAVADAKLSGGARYVGGDPKNGLVVSSGYQPHDINSKQTQRFIDADNLKQNPMAEAQQFVKTLSRRGTDLEEVRLNPPSLEDERPSETLRMVVRTVEVSQYPDDYFMIDLKNPRVRYKDTSILPLPNLDVGYDKRHSRVDYLGPELGFNRDLGGLYFNPGYDIKVGPGALKLSPMISYGQTIDRSESTINIREPEFGVGFMSSYRTDRFKLAAARNFMNDYNVLSGEFNFIPGQRNTKFIATQNAFAGSNLFTQERPSWGVRIQDERTIFRDKLFALNMNHSGGIFKDDFFPFNNAEPFVTPQSTTPATAGRFQQQLNLYNTRPLFKIGNNLELGFNAQASNAYYTTDDYLSVLRAGPTASLFIGDVFMSQAAYKVGAISGRSPFAFDSFFLGKETLSLNNALRLGPYAMIGMRQDFNLSNDNARNESLVGNTIYLSIGSRNLKFMVGYDTIFRITRFGISYYPNTTEAEVEFEDAYVVNAIQPLDPSQMNAFRRWRERRNGQ